MVRLPPAYLVGTLNDELFLCTRIVRDEVEYDVTVDFAATMIHPGYPATRDEAGEAAEFLVEFLAARFDDPSDAPGPLTEIEHATLRKWFDEHEGQAWECANDNREI